MTARAAVGSLSFALLVLGPGVLTAQGYRLRLDTRFQTVAFRGVSPDSIAVGSAVVGPTGGFETPDGFAVTCTGGSEFCRFYRAGP